MDKKKKGLLGMEGEIFNEFHERETKIMNEFLTCCPNCMMPLFFVLPVDEVKIICPECGLRLYGRKKVLYNENRMARYLSRGIAPRYAAKSSGLDTK